MLRRRHLAKAKTSGKAEGRKETYEAIRFGGNSAGSVPRGASTLGGLMEGRLFFISIWCGVYGLLLRQVFKSNKLSHTTSITMMLNSLFWATGAAMLGMLLSSYFEKLEEMG